MRSTIFAVGAMMAFVECNDPREKQAGPPLELRFQIDGGLSKPGEGEIVGRWELINHSSEWMEFEHPVSSGLRPRFSLVWLDPECKPLGEQSYLIPHSTGSEWKVSRLPPGGSLTETMNLTDELHRYAAKPWSQVPAGVYRVRLYFHHKRPESIGSNWILMDLQRYKPKFLHVGSDLQPVQPQREQIEPLKE